MSTHHTHLNNVAAIQHLYLTDVLADQLDQAALLLVIAMLLQLGAQDLAAAPSNSPSQTRRAADREILEIYRKFFFSPNHRYPWSGSPEPFVP